MFGLIDASIYGFIVGDALGVPVEFIDRKKLIDNPVVDMIEYGTHNVPKGSWSDDTAMMLATMDAFKEFDNNVIDYSMIMDNFLLWIDHGKYSSTDKGWGIGRGTLLCVAAYHRGIPLSECGENDFKKNGNGSLMRILPMVLYCHYNDLNDKQTLEVIKKTSQLTHAHEINVVACFLYTRFFREVLDTKDINQSYEYMKRTPISFDSKDSKEVFHRILESDIGSYPVDEIQSSGYVIHTLEAVLWVLLNSENKKNALLKAVNLGQDTDTIAALVGAVAAVIYGIEDIPRDWLLNIRKRDLLETILQEFKQNLIENKR